MCTPTNSMWAVRPLFVYCVVVNQGCQKWHVASRKALQIGILDNLFALPSPFALFGSVRLSPSLLIRPIGVSVFIHALLIVNILAPNALTIGLSEPVTKEIQVPTLDMGSVIGAILAWQHAPVSSPFPFPLNLTPTSQLIMNSILLHPEIKWNVPQGCESTCDFELEYDGVALQCHDMAVNTNRPRDCEITGSEMALVYSANVTGPPIFDPAEADPPYGLTINYAEIYRGEGEGRCGTENVTVHPAGGVDCQLRNATYQTTFSFGNGVQRIDTSIKRTKISSLYGAVLRIPVVIYGC